MAEDDFLKGLGGPIPKPTEAVPQSAPVGPELGRKADAPQPPAGEKAPERTGETSQQLSPLEQFKLKMKERVGSAVSAARAGMPSLPKLPKFAIGRKVPAGRPGPNRQAAKKKAKPVQSRKLTWDALVDAKQVSPEYSSLAEAEDIIALFDVMEQKPLTLKKDMLEWKKRFGKIEHFLKPGPAWNEIDKVLPEKGTEARKKYDLTMVQLYLPVLKHIAAPIVAQLDGISERDAMKKIIQMLRNS